LKFLISIYWDFALHPHVSLKMLPKQWLFSIPFILVWERNLILNPCPLFVVDQKALKTTTFTRGSFVVVTKSRTPMTFTINFNKNGAKNWRFRLFCFQGLI
jgi:hypothetical protein